ncbi:MAG: AAA family ATPase [Verrucomicrobiota bacterium]
MLERIEQIQGVGLLHDANGKPFKWQRATLIYADNGRGKSTLASVLRSIATGDASLMAARTTVDGTLPPAGVLQFGSGHKVSFVAGKWSETRPELLVFDSDFIDKNVHSGGAVSTGHRKNLLQFALGEKAVAARLAEDKATNEAKAASDAVQQLNGQLSGYHQGTTLALFEKLPEAPDADKQIEDLQKRVMTANNSALILKKPLPAVIPLPTFDLDALFLLLHTTIEKVQADAEAIVRAHIGKLASPTAESWLSQGRSFDDGHSCPYCAQPTEGVDLIRAYQTHFNAAYSELKAKVGKLDRSVATALSSTVVSTFANGVSTANATAAAWEDNVAITPISFDSTLASCKLQELEALLMKLVTQKQTNPILGVGSDEDRATANNLWAELTQMMQAANHAIGVTRTAIESFRQKLATENIQQLQLQIQQLQFAMRRHTPAVKALVAQLIAARIASSNAEARKTTARDNLDGLMKQLLKDYEQSIHALLKKFGASFTMEKMDANFRGSAPRSEYGLALRGKSIPLEGGPPSFATALSEGDKRTLAFTFFVASTLADPQLANRVVVIDDPMCSLDLNRKQHTRTVLKQIYAGAEQLVVLAHDPYFIRDLRDALTAKDSTAAVSIFQLHHALAGYTDFAKCDVDQECESPYYRHNRLLVDFMTNGSGDHTHIAKAIRPMLEGYLHRRFPGLIPRDLMFGQVVAFINDAKPPHPVCFAKGLVTELNEINDYAGQFHHDTNPGKADTVVVVPSELRTFAERTLTVVYKGTA